MSKNYRAELVGVFGDPVDDNPTGLWKKPHSHTAASITDTWHLAPLVVMEEQLRKEFE